MTTGFPDVPKAIFTSESESDGNNAEESQDAVLLNYPNESFKLGGANVIDLDSVSRSNPGENLENSLISHNSNNQIYSKDFKSNMTEKSVRNIRHCVFSSSSDSLTNSPTTSPLPHSTPVVNMKNPNIHGKSPSLSRNFHNLSLRIFSEDCDDEECLKPSFSILEIELDNKPDPIENSVSKINEASDDSDSFEALMARIRGSPAAPVKKLEPVHGDSSFIVSDSDLSETSEDLNFYRRIESRTLRESIKKINKVRRRVRLKSSSSASSTKEEAIEISKADTSEHEESDYRSEVDEISPHKLLLPPHRTGRPQHAKAAKSDPFKETGNERSGDVRSTLPFIYSLDSFEKPSSSKSCQRRHPSAERFVKNFKKNREELANRLYLFYNNIVFDNKLPKDLKVQWNERLLKTAGQCVYMKRKVKNPDGTSAVNNEVKIELSGKVCTSAERVRDTLLHETCHAAVWTIHGVNDGHGRLWRAFVQRANSTFPGLPPVTVRHTYAIEARYTYRCTGCFATINRHSKSLDIHRKVCGRCKSRFELFVNKNGKMILIETSQSSTQPGVQMTSRSKPVFAEFVKDHYKEIRGEVSSHKDAMTQLGSLFRSIRIDPDKENE